MPASYPSYNFVLDDDDDLDEVLGPFTDQLGQQIDFSTGTLAADFVNSGGTTVFSCADTDFVRVNSNSQVRMQKARADISSVAADTVLNYELKFIVTATGFQYTLLKGTLTRV